MIQYKLFPRSKGIVPDIKAIVDCFISANEQINLSVNNLPSNGVVLLDESLSKLGFKL